MVSGVTEWPCALISGVYVLPVKAPATAFNSSNARLPPDDWLVTLPRTGAGAQSLLKTPQVAPAE